MKHFLSVCCIVRQEAPYIAEWLEFHILQGVEHFYIYENDSTDNITQVLKPYQRDGLVTLINYPGNKQQIKAYQHCLDTYGKETEWVAFIDIDEFLYIKEPWTLKDFFTITLETSSCMGGVAARWIHFGSSGYEDKTPGLVIERFTRRSALPDKHVKSIVRPASGVFTGKNPHSFRFPAGVFAVDEEFKKLPEEYAIMRGQSIKTLTINHYHTKSKAEYVERRLKPDANSGVPSTKERVEERFHAHDLNEVEDTYLRDTYAGAIHAAIQKRFSGE